MKKVANRMGLVFAVVAACLMCCLISFSSGQKPEVELRTITTLEGMRHELAHVQLETLPIDRDFVVIDGGDYLFAPATDDLAAGMLPGALIPCESAGRRFWLITLYEDPESRDMVILDAEGGEAVRLPCAPDYHPGWVFDMFFPLSFHISGADAYDPARVALALRLVLREDGLALFRPDQANTKEGGISIPESHSTVASDQGLVTVSASSHNPVSSVTLAPGDVARAANDNKHTQKSSTNSMSRASDRKSGGRANKTLYVDRLKGCDTWSGRSSSAPSVDSLEGPKRTILAGHTAASKKELLVVRGGNYSEGINVRGHKKGNVVIRGDVRLTRVYENVTAASAAFSMRRKDASVAPTGTVTQVTQ